MSEKQQRRLIAVSNRLPIAVDRDDQGQWQLTAGAGGLVTALAPVLKHHRGMWIGWPGCGEEAPLDSLLEGFAAGRVIPLRPFLCLRRRCGSTTRGFPT